MQVQYDWLYENDIGAGRLYGTLRFGWGLPFIDVDGSLATAVTTAYVETTATDAIGNLDDLSEFGF